MLEVELAEKEAGKKAAVKKRDYDTAGKLSKQVKALKAELEAIAASGAKKSAAAAELEPKGPTVNGRYPNLPIQPYVDDKLFCKINTSYPGLQVSVNAKSTTVEPAQNRGVEGVNESPWVRDLHAEFVPSSVS